MRAVETSGRERHMERGELALYVMDALEESAKDAVERHVLACEACSEALAREARLEAAFEVVAQRPVEIPVVVPISAATKHDARRARQHRWLGGIAGALAAAAAIVMALASGSSNEPAAALGARALWDDASEVRASGTLAESGFVEASNDRLDGG